MAFLAPLALPALRLAAPALMSAGLGYMTDDDHSIKSVAGDAFMGAALGGMGSKYATKAAGRFLPPNVLQSLPGGIQGPLNQVVNPWIGRSGIAGRAMGGMYGLMPGLPDNEPQSNPANVLAGPYDFMQRFMGLQLPGQEPEVDHSMGFNKFFNSIDGNRDPAAFSGKSMMGWMNDPRANKIIDESIVAANKPHREAIKDEKEQLKTDLANIKELEKEYQRASKNRIKEHSSGLDDIREKHEESANSISQDADAALKNILSMYNTSDDGAQREMATEAASKRINQDEDGADLADKIGEVDSSYLSEIAAVEAAQSEQDKRDRKTEGRKAIREQKRGISSNWANRRGMLAELAQSLADDDLQKYQMDISNAGQKNNFLGQALQMYLGSAGEAPETPQSLYDAALAKETAKLVAKQGFVDISQNNPGGGTITQMLPVQGFGQIAMSADSPYGDDQAKQAQAWQQYMDSQGNMGYYG